MSIIQNFTKKIAAVAVAAAALSAATAAVEARPLDVIKQSGEVVIGVFSDKAPFGYVDSQGKYAGYDVYFGDRLAKDLGVKVKYISVDPASRVEFLVTDKVDIILANFTVTKDRAEKVDFALPYMKVALGVVSPESAVITDVKQLDGKTLIIAKGTTAEPYFEKNHPKVKLQKYDQYTDAYNALLDGRGDAFSTDNTEVLAWALVHKGFKVGIPSLAILTPSLRPFRKAIKVFSIGSIRKSSILGRKTSSTRTMQLRSPRSTEKRPIPMISWLKAASSDLARA